MISIPLMSVNATHEGDIAGLLTEMQILAWEIVGLQAPQRLRLQRGGETDKPTVAVLDFEGRGISVMEAQTLTDRFTTSMSSTDRVQLVERGVMSEVLEEQGMTGAECTSQECAAEVGAMLGVQFMVNGAIGKLGDTYTIDVKMFSVATGAAESMKSVTYAGKVDGLIVEIGSGSTKKFNQETTSFCGRWSNDRWSSRRNQLDAVGWNRISRVRWCSCCLRWR